MKVDETIAVATVAAASPAARAVFEELGIDYACGGSRSLADAAYVEGLDPEVLTASLRRLAPPAKTAPWDERSLSELVQYLVNEHHHFVRDEMGTVALQLADVCASAPEVAEFQSLRASFTRISETVLPHMKDEERNIFPTIEALESASQSNRAPAITNGELRMCIERVVAEHGTISAQLRTTRELRLRLLDSNDLPPRCRPILSGLAVVEAHLHEYMFLENCILFPRAIALQEQMEAA